MLDTNIPNTENSYINEILNNFKDINDIKLNIKKHIDQKEHTFKSSDILRNIEENDNCEMGYYMCAECCLTFDKPNIYEQHLNNHASSSKVDIYI